MSGQSGGHRLRLSKLNDQLTCKLCGGYFIDATTIIECLHSFCRSCIVKYLENNKYCPICEVQVHKSKPLLNIRPDYTLQDIVYKLVPGCYQNEMRCRREFYSKHPEAYTQTTSPEARGEPIESHIYSPDESLSLSLEYFRPSRDVKEIAVKPFLKRYLRCPAAVTIFHLQKLIRAKYGLTDAHRVDVMYKEEPLCSNYTLMDVMYIYHWRRKVPLHLSYRIFESSAKRIKLSEDNVNYKTSLFYAGIDPIESKEEEPIKREWKEVQLKISETGIMSITDITDQEFKKNARVQDSVTSVETINSSIVKGSTSENNASEIITKNDHSLNRQIVDDCNISSKLSEFDDKKNSNSMETKKTPAKEAENIVMCKSEEETKDKLDNNNVADKVTLHTNVQFRETTQSVVEPEVRGNVIDDKDKKESLKNNNSIIIKEKNGESLKQYRKNEVKLVNMGSKINALSVKLQFQPKIGQTNASNASSKKIMKEKKIMPQPSKKIDTKTIQTSKSMDPKSSFDTSKTQAMSNNCGITGSKSSVPSSTKTMSQKPTSESEETPEPVASTRVTTAISSKPKETKLNVKNVQSIGQHQSSLQEQSTSEKETHSSDQTSVEITQGMEQTNTTLQKSPYTQIESLTNKNTSSLDFTATVGNGVNSISTSTSQTTSTFPYTVQDLVSSTMLKNSLKSLATSTVQKLSATTVSENTVTMPTVTENPTALIMPSMSISSSLKNSYVNSGLNTSRESPLKPNLEVTAAYSVPPCPDAIPISLMKPTIRKNELITKGSNLNDICAKIGASGSKINDICAKIGENSKEKNKTEARSKCDIPDLLKIGRKCNSSSIAIDSVNKQQHPNISNVSVYASSSSVIATESKNVYSNVKDSLRATSLISTSPTATSHSIQKVPSSVSKKQSQAVGYKTLRDPPRCWNPTLSKNNYVAVKNQTKETQSHLHQIALSERRSIQSKPAKIFKMRNMPRYLGNPASGVKPLYGIGNESKEKEQSTMTSTTTTNTSTNSKNGNLSMMKIDPKTLSPIVSTINSPIVSPPPYSPSARNYSNPSFSRDICRSTGSPISPKNSPVNMLSTSPFIPSPTPNMNPRLIYPHFPPPFPDTPRFPNPLIRPPIGIPSPSAFHSSLPPSINKLYQRSSYIPQTTGFNPVSQPPTVQRIPPSTYSTPKSPKTTSLTAISPTSYGLTKSETQIVGTSLETSNMHLLENAPQEDLSVFNLSKTGNFGNTETVKPPTEVTRNSKSSGFPSISNTGQGNNTIMTTSKSKSETSQFGAGYDQSKEQSEKTPAKCDEVNSYSPKGQNSEKNRSDEISDSVNKRKEKSVSQTNGGLTDENNEETPVEKQTEQHKEQNQIKMPQQVPEKVEKQQEETNHNESGKSEEHGKRSEAQISKTEA